MNLEPSSSKKPPVTSNDDFLMEDFDFKPITSGLGFHHAKAAEVKPVFTDKTLPTPVMTPMTPVRKEMSVYQNDLSLFYNNGSATAPVQAPQVPEEEKIERVYHLASKSQRVVAYFMDLFVVASILGIVLTVMARTISMDIMEVWTAFPNEITPLVLVLFSGFYLIYFSIFEKSGSSTLGKNVLGLKIVTSAYEAPSFTSLFVRSLITLTNFLSLGLFAWFDLQNKVTQLKVIKD